MKSSSRIRTYLNNRRVCDGGDVGCSSRRASAEISRILQGSPSSKLGILFGTPSSAASSVCSYSATCAGPIQVLDLAQPEVDDLPRHPPPGTKNADWTANAVSGGPNERHRPHGVPIRGSTEAPHGSKCQHRVAGAYSVGVGHIDCSLCPSLQCQPLAGSAS
jgi:hypothetical protein